MSGAALVVSIISILAVLFLVGRGMSHRKLGFQRMAMLALVWIVIILGLVLVLQQVGA